MVEHAKTRKRHLPVRVPPAGLVPPVSSLLTLVSLHLAEIRGPVSTYSTTTTACMFGIMSISNETIQTLACFNLSLGVTQMMPSYCILVFALQRFQLNISLV